MCTFGLSGCRVKPRRPHQTGPPGLHTTTRELQTCTFERPGASNTTKIPRKDPKREKEDRKLWREEGKKKREILGPPPFGPPPFGPPTLRGSTLRGPTFSRFGSPPSGPPPLGSPTLCGPKIQHLKIGRSRNWPKSILAEVEIGRSRIGRTRKNSWPKSKLAEVDHPPRTGLKCRFLL